MESHTTCRRYQKFRQRDFSHEPLAGHSQKIEMGEWTYKLCANWKGACRTVVTQQTISVRLHMMGMVQKEGIWIPHELSENNKNQRRNTVFCFQSSGKKIFCIKSLQTMKSGFFMIILNVENHGLTLVNLRHWHQSPISTPRRFCSVSSGIGKGSCIMSCTIG